MNHFEDMDCPSSRSFTTKMSAQGKPTLQNSIGMPPSSPHHWKHMSSSCRITVRCKHNNTKCRPTGPPVNKTHPFFLHVEKGLCNFSAPVSSLWFCSARTRFPVFWEAARRDSKLQLQVCARARVCVWNIWIDVKLLSCFFKAGGMRLSRKRMPTKLCVTVEAQSDQLCVPAISTMTLVLLQWHGAKPIIPKTILHRLRFCTVFAIWFYSDFHTTGLSSSPSQNAELWMYLFNLGFISPFLFTSEDSLLSITSLILLAWDSVPYRSYEGSILV